SPFEIAGAALSNIELRSSGAIVRLEALNFIAIPQDALVENTPTEGVSLSTHFIHFLLTPRLVKERLWARSPRIAS
ncbi:MAG TPA: hypothetical protein VL134_05220, partial [Leptolyngbya sp.]|nr:hypothetical protein [Leptolyngbya sp.]